MKPREAYNVEPYVFSGECRGGTIATEPIRWLSTEVIRRSFDIGP